MQNDVNFACGWRIWQTDTASVLMEAIGYIKFLHNQIEVFLNFPTFFLILGFLILTIWPISLRNTNNSLSLRNFKFFKDETAGQIRVYNTYR